MLAKVLLAEEALLHDAFAQHLQTPIVRDGVVGAEAYLASPIKICLALKDAYGNETESWSLIDYITGQGKGHTWATVAKWLVGIRALPVVLPWAAIESQTANPLTVLQGFAVMNMKKIASPQAETNLEQLYQIGLHPANQKLLAAQWQLYAPTITLCGSWGPFTILLQALGGQETECQQTFRGEHYWRHPQGGVLLLTPHPSARYPAAIKHYGVIEAVQELLNIAKPQHA